MTFIGNISITQIQRDPLKRGDEPNQIYIPAPLLHVEEIVVTKKGIFGMGLTGQRILDAHHVDHSKSRNATGKNGVSIGFVGHYNLMQEKFGAHMTVGIAGENIIIDSDHPYTLKELKKGISIESAETGERFDFSLVKVMEPCAPFSRFAMKTKQPLSADESKDTLQFLSNGRRGFVIMPESDDEFSLHPGDKVYLR